MPVPSSRNGGSNGFERGTVQTIEPFLGHRPEAQVAGPYAQGRSAFNSGRFEAKSG